MNGLNYVFAAVPSCSAKELLALELPVNPDSCIMASLSPKQMGYKIKNSQKNLQNKQTTNSKGKLSPDIRLLRPHEKQLNLCIQLIVIIIIMTIITC